MSKYLYNGVELPALPEWDRWAYPYALIAKEEGNSSNPRYLFAFKEEIKLQGPLFLNYYANTVEGRSPSEPYYRALLDDNQFMWGELTEYDPNGETLPPCVGVPFWSNFDLYTREDDLYLAASYPIDAETGEEIHDYEIVPVFTTAPQSLTAGWLVGNKIAAMRGKV